MYLASEDPPCSGSGSASSESVIALPLPLPVALFEKEIVQTRPLESSGSTEMLHFIADSRILEPIQQRLEPMQVQERATDSARNYGMIPQHLEIEVDSTQIQHHSRVEKETVWKRCFQISLIGACIAASLVLVLDGILIVRENTWCATRDCSYDYSWTRQLQHSWGRILQPSGNNSEANYAFLFGDSIRGSPIASSSRQGHSRSLSDHSFKLSRSVGGSNIVIAGKLIIEESPCNIGQMDLETMQWSLKERIQLSLYNSYSGGEVYSLLANHTSIPISKSTSASGRKQDPQMVGSGELIVVGAFDVTHRNSQVTYCSVGKWDGEILSKVGEGLCNSALSKGMKITTASMAGPSDVYVAGSFLTQVWQGNSHEFVKIYNIAHFNAVDQVWLPLNIGQITCSWCTVTVLALAWDPKAEQLHVAGKFNSIDGANIPAGLAVYDLKSGRLVAHPGGGVTMKNETEDGVTTALQFDEESGVLYVMGSFERLSQTGQMCLGLAAYEVLANRWTCLADRAHTVTPTGGGNMLLTPYGLMVAGKISNDTTWNETDKTYTIAVLNATLKNTSKVKHTPSAKGRAIRHNFDDDVLPKEDDYLRTHDFTWSWLPGFNGHTDQIHSLSNGFGEYHGTVFIAGDNLVARWSYVRVREPLTDGISQQTKNIPLTEVLSGDHVRGAIMAISQMNANEQVIEETLDPIGYTLIVYCVAVGAVIGMFLAVLCNKNLKSAALSVFKGEGQLEGISLDTLTYGSAETPSIAEAYKRAMRTRYVQHPQVLTLIDPQEIYLQRIIGEGTFGRVWSANWRSAKVAVKEFVFAQAAVAGKSSMQQQIIEEIIGEAGMMAMLRHPNVLQLFGCSLTAQAIWIVSELCSLGSLRQLLDDNEVSLPVGLRLQLALQVAEGMCYLHNQEQPIIHRDLKSHNIFVHETLTEMPKRPRTNDNLTQPVASKVMTESSVVAKIGDWGSARATLSGSRTMTHGVGTACWLAPEVIKHARSSKYSDVYGFGIVLWELATREEVYQGLETTQIIAKVANESLRPPVPQDCPWKHLMVKCWEENPLDRLSFNSVVKELNKIYKATVESQVDTPPKAEVSIASYQNS